MSLPFENDDDFTYGSYLMIPELLSLQQCVSIDDDTGRPEHDETLFIIIHQVYELWFKQMRHEGAFLASALDADDVPTASATLNRMLAIMKTMVAQIDVLETMTPISFLSFRSFLSSSSGFQSWQFRAFEFMLSGRDILADEAAEIGLVSKVVPDADLLPEAIELAKEDPSVAQDV